MKNTLHQAVDNNDTKAFTEALILYPNETNSTHNSVSLLHRVCFWGNKKMLQQLLNGKDINIYVVNNELRNVLHFIVEAVEIKSLESKERDYIGCFKLLLEYEKKLPARERKDLLSMEDCNGLTVQELIKKREKLHGTNSNFRKMLELIKDNKSINLLENQKSAIYSFSFLIKTMSSLFSSSEEEEQFLLSNTTKYKKE